MAIMPRELAVSVVGGEARTIHLEGQRLSLGRAGANQLNYPEDLGLSRQHLALEREGDGWLVRDLGSKNGTFVNGVRIAAPHRLRPGDRITASRATLVYEPSATGPEKTVLFEGVPVPEGHTVSVTLGNLLGGEGPPEPGAAPAPAHWGSAVTALVRVGRELAARRPLPELFEVSLNLALDAVGAQRGVLITSEKGRLAVQAARGDNFRISTAVRDRVLEGKTSLLVQDVEQDEALRDRGSIVRHGVRSLMAVPLQTDERVIGLIYVDTPHLLREFTAEDLSLLTVMANVAAIRIERERLVEVEQSERLLEQEFEQAAEVQRWLLPAEAPVVAGVDLAGQAVPCRAVGGDYYDFLAYPDGKVGLVIADVAGKGMPAAMMMTGLQAKVQALAESAVEPEALVGRLNRSLCATYPDNRFVTLFYCVLDPRNGELTYCNAGHNPPLLLRPGDDVVRLEEGGPVLGVLPAARFLGERVRFEPGDVLLLYSDGVTEAVNPAGEEFGEERLVGILKREGYATAQAIVTSVYEAVQAWTEGQPAADDITVVAACRGGRADEE